jgi:cytochrome c5
VKKKLAGAAGYFVFEEGFMKKTGLLLLALIFLIAGLAGVVIMARTPDRYGYTYGPGGLRGLMMGRNHGAGMRGRATMGYGRGGFGQMRNMMQGMMPELLPPGVTPENLPDPKSQGAKLLVRYCHQCHNLPSPSMHSAEEWPDIATRMFYRTKMMSGRMGIESPTQEEQVTIVNYLKSYALKPATSELPAAESPAAILFKQTCTQCHPLPDPKSHTAAEWPAIVERMKSNMEFWHKRVITDEEKSQILTYLEANAKKQEVTRKAPSSPIEQNQALGSGGVENSPES